MLSPFDSITVFGGTSYDLVVEVPSFPAADDKIWGAVRGRFFGGMGANVAWTFARLGGVARLFSRVGEDTAGGACLAALRDEGVRIDDVLIAGETFETVAFVDATGEKAMVMLAPPDAQTLPRPSPPMLAGDKVVHVAVSSNAPPLKTVGVWVERGVRVSLDIEPTMIDDDIGEWLSLATFLFCGEEASRTLTGVNPIEGRIERLHQLGPSHVSVTRGRLGARVSVMGERAISLAAEDVRPVDTTGAGDCFVGTALYGIGKGWSIERWATIANRAAGRSTEVLGSRDPSLTLESLLRPTRNGG